MSHVDLIWPKNQGFGIKVPPSPVANRAANGSSEPSHFTLDALPRIVACENVSIKPQMEVAAKYVSEL
jgi:hypothetical protein